MTLYDQEASFSNYGTFAIRDSVILISNYLTDAQIATFYTTGGTSDRLRNLIEENFIAMGYTKAADPATADFYLNNIAMKMETTTYYYPGWWYGYGGYYPWYPYWKKKNTSYYWYPYYPGYGGGYSYNTYYGTLYTEMIDAQSLIDADGNTPINILWQVFLNGVVSETLSYDPATVNRGFDEAFEQSPYLFE
ncbi:MAG: hypothetical protein DRJ10_15550 [Bacteroidetes bacterium]|nr:MAG: hypothetical protein DRJ10_15550 [Bacteroidota bacterium]